MGTGVPSTSVNLSAEFYKFAKSSKMPTFIVLLHLGRVSSTIPPVMMPLFSVSNHDWERVKEAIRCLLVSSCSTASIWRKQWTRPQRLKKVRKGTTDCLSLTHHGYWRCSRILVQNTSRLQAVKWLICSLCQTKSSRGLNPPCKHRVPLCHHLQWQVSQVLCRVMALGTMLFETPEPLEFDFFSFDPVSFTIPSDNPGDYPNTVEQVI